MATLPSGDAQERFHQLANCMKSNGKVRPHFKYFLHHKYQVNAGYELKGHRQTGPTDCPGETFINCQMKACLMSGDALYFEIQSWPHWTDGNIGKEPDFEREM